MSGFGDVRDIFDAALKAVDPYAAVFSHLPEARKRYVQGAFNRLMVVAAGKGAYPMCRAVEDFFADLPLDGVAITKYGHGGVLKRIKLYEAAHPVPDEKGVNATVEAVELLSSADEKTLVLCLISGGGSALLVAPIDGITLADKQEVTGLLLKSGADIGALNAVRKHLSRIKGGNLAKIASPATVFSLILSDVIGDPLDVIASGPTAPDVSTFHDALDILKRYDILDIVYPSVKKVIVAGADGFLSETPKPGSDIFSRIENIIVGNNRKALDAAADKAGSIGLETVITTSELSGDVRKVASELARSALEKIEILSSGDRLCFLSGGETTVTVGGKGKGGRNMELALLFAKEIDGVDGITLLSAGTDGTDGPTDAAGAIVDGNTLSDASLKGLDATDYLADNDSYNFFRDAGGLLVTGPTGTNVMDIQVLLLEGK